MRQGKIVMDDERGFGFISREWQDVLFDQSAVEKDEFCLLSVGRVAAYEFVRDADSCCGMPQAVSVRMQ